jgi:hypothetical protein
MFDGPHTTLSLQQVTGFRQVFERQDIALSVHIKKNWDLRIGSSYSPTY